MAYALPKNHVPQKQKMYVNIDDGQIKTERQLGIDYHEYLLNYDKICFEEYLDMSGHVEINK